MFQILDLWVSKLQISQQLGGDGEGGINVDFSHEQSQEVGYWFYVQIISEVDSYSY